MRLIDRFRLLLGLVGLVPSVLLSQNVGIGTATPLEKLHVAGNIRLDALAGVDTRLAGIDPNGTLTELAAGLSGQVLVQGPTGPIWQDDSGWGLLGNAGINPATNFLGTTDAQPLVLRTNNAEAMRVLANGQVCVNGWGPLPNDRFSVYAAGPQSAVSGYASGTGYAAYFQNYGLQHSLVSWATGTGGSAAQFVSNHSTNPIQPTVYVYNGSAAAAGLFLRSDLANPNAHGIQLDINGASTKRGIVIDMDAATSGPGEAILQYGAGHGLTIQSFNATNPLASLLAHQAGTGRAVEAVTFLPTSTIQTAYFGQASTGLLPGTYSNATALWAQSGGIRGGAFLSAGNSSSNTVLQAVYNGSGGNFDGVGVYGLFQPNPNYGYGVVGQGNWFGVYANGNLGASGVKSFMIDHPQDPENKYLRHFSIESPEVLNLYRGSVVLDANGKAEVQLPSYFHAVNIDFSYQLTPVGSAAAVYVSQEIDAQGRFAIGGGNAGQKVSWTVYADRNDPFVQQNSESISVEPAKRVADVGLYLQPELYGQPKEKGLFERYKVRPEEVKREVLPETVYPEVPVPDFKGIK